MTVIPEATKYFWDVDAHILDTERDAGFIIRRLLEHGDVASVRWLLAAYTPERIRGVLKTARGLSRQSGFFWQRFFDMHQDELLCLQTPSHNRAMGHWSPSVKAVS